MIVAGLNGYLAGARSDKVGFSGMPAVASTRTAELWIPCGRKPAMTPDRIALAEYQDAALMGEHRLHFDWGADELLYARTGIRGQDVHAIPAAAGWIST
jgi:hypothetical protein